MNTTRIGDVLEEQMYKLLQAEIDTDRFFAKASCCRIFRKKGYHSRDRGGDIIFDISIEISLPGASQYSVLMLIECKNYTHSVPVDDVEEFFAKVQQVAAANCKAVLASSASFQSGTRSFAASKGVGLLRYFDTSNFKWELLRSPSAGARSRNSNSSLVSDGLSLQNFSSNIFDMYMQSPIQETNSLWVFFEDILLDGALPPKLVRKISNPRGKLASQVPFLEKDELEAQSMESLQEIGYVEGEVSLEDICSRESQLHQLTVRTGVPHFDPTSQHPALGRIAFDPLEIQIFEQASPNYGRERFTLAHELAHHLLSHGRYMSRERCDESDFVLHRRGESDDTDIARMEIQANYFASSLLMPRAHFIEDFRRVLRDLNIADKGFGELYVDDQNCNKQNYNLVTSQLMKRYGVSRVAATIRLESLGLLRDARSSLSIGSTLTRTLERSIGTDDLLN